MQVLMLGIVGRKSRGLMGIYEEESIYNSYNSYTNFTDALFVREKNR